MLAYALTIFTGAFLLFQVQPLMGKFILPWFGGGPGVWTTCMLFFQLLLLGGYAYAHFITRRLAPKRQALLHGALLLGALALLPITPATSWKPAGGGEPVSQILLLLTASVGLPYFVLSATGPLLQEWFRRLHPGVSPYRLYALSNTGSLLALVSYPFYFEPHFSRKTQAAFWTWGLGLFVIGCGWCAFRLWREGGNDNSSAGQTDGEPATAPGWRRLWLWLTLPACASALLLATTNKMCQDVAVIPFLWVLPLALYLLTFIICFDHPRWYQRWLFGPLLAVALAAACWAMFKGTSASIFSQVGIYSGALWVCCMMLHGELYSLKPHPRFLTTFYLMIAAGGALGGLFVAVVAPVIFRGYYEIHWALLLCAVLFTLICIKERETLSEIQWRMLATVLTLLIFISLDRSLSWLGAYHKSKHALQTPLLVTRWCLWGFLVFCATVWLASGRWRQVRRWRLICCAYLVFGCLALGATLWTQAAGGMQDVLGMWRNFYGVLTVFDYQRTVPDSHYLMLQHGRITHGMQFMEPERSRWVTTYYADGSGVALALQAFPTSQPRHIGVVGLGTGTLAARARPGDRVRIYEINPAVRSIATQLFTYLTNCPGKVEVILGDARLSMENEPPQNFDLLALDAFSSDAIPVHLLTREAVEIYRRHLKPDGVLAIHISNRYLDLEPVVAGLADYFGYHTANINFSDDFAEDWWVYSSTWVLLSRNHELLSQPAIREAASILGRKPNLPLWTDDFASLFPILQR